MRKTTLWIMIESWKIFLWEKKTGMARWVFTSVGWKLEDGETIEACMIREAHEEICIELSRKDLEKVWVMNFYFSETPQYNNVCHVYILHNYSWEIVETLEIRPVWFDLKSIPYDKMWDFDKIWLPLVLNWERNIEFTAWYDDDSGVVKKYKKWLH